MVITPRNQNYNVRSRKFQEGGEMMPAEDPAMAGEEMGGEEMGAPEAGGGDPIMQIAQMAAQALQAQDCNAAMAVCEAFIQLVQQAQGGGGPEAAPEGEPVYRRGGKLAYRIRK